MLAGVGLRVQGIKLEEIDIPCLETKRAILLPWNGVRKSRISNVFYRLYMYEPESNEG